MIKNAVDLKVIENAKKKDALARTLVSIFALLFFIVVGFFVFSVIFRGLRDFDLSFFGGRRGLLGVLWNTVYLTILSLLISVPLGVATGIYLSYYSDSKSALNTILRAGLRTLSGLPSIVVGLFGYLAFVLFTGTQWSLWAGALTVSILNIPLMATSTEEALDEIDSSIYFGSMALGATREQTLIHVLLPQCLHRLVTGVVLSAGRVVAEAAALMYTAGSTSDILFSGVDFNSPLNAFNPNRPGKTLALHIWGARTQAHHATASQEANVASALLLILVVAISLTAYFVKVHWSKKLEGGKNQ
ncbi:Phosphate transport system permease protein pstA [Urinicoccus massiliensis]|uniref:Phosphate transport system permease protein pstA n=1 Tax=Urinicoccus massiliensis TaxID=1723382 RepID=A0A8H2QX81_9FIRM|nr:ABC transporter permease subunit [Urinicoccus massiliensis]VFB15539.1 Phosphate transport system permease protein pstA [Urinicoccus massiliensis]